MTERNFPAEPPALPDRWLQIEDLRVRYVDTEAPGPGEHAANERPTFVLVHGLGGALTNWEALIPLLADHGRVLALDLAGFGRTEATAPMATVAANDRLLASFIRALSLPPVVLIGNSMGGMIGARVAATQPELVESLILVDPALPGSPAHRPHPMVVVAFGAYLVPPLGRRLLAVRANRLTPEQAVRETFRLVVAHLSRVPPWLLDRHVVIAKERLDSLGDSASETFLAAARSVILGSLRRPAYQRSLGAIGQPVLLLHGDRDRLVNVLAARAAAARHPSWTYAEGRDLGHCPMFEDPVWVRDQVLGWLAGRGALHPTGTAAGRE